MKKILLSSLCGLLGVASFGQTKMEQDQEAILAMQGCYRVTFRFAETFSPDKEYKTHKGHQSRAIEWVKAIKNEPGDVILQHLLIVGPKKNQTVIKHWRQDWKYENTDLYLFHQTNYDTKGQEWKYVSLTPEEVKGQWTQKVYQVDDSPRYEGSATWVHVDGKHYWENQTDAPLPRREYSVRDDYNVTRRTNRHMLTSYGWLHEQDNDKVFRMNGNDQVIASEKGWNTYEKLPESKCQAAKTWWEENKEVWKPVRKAWDNRFAEKKDLSLWPKKGEKLMYEEFFSLKEGVTPAQVTEIIEKYSHL